MTIEVPACQCRTCHVMPEAIAWPEYEQADVICMRCGIGITGWPVEAVVAEWNKYQESRKLIVVTPPSADKEKRQ